MRCTRISHKTIRRLSRKLSHGTTRGRKEKVPNYFPEIITALRRTIKLHRRLMKVAPMMFDYGLRNKLERQIAEQEAWNQQVEVMLRKVYGDADPIKPTGHTSAFDFLVMKVRDPWNSLSRAKQRRVQELYTEWELWMRIARDLMAKVRAQLQSPIPSLTIICNLLEVAFTLGRLATGLESRASEPSVDFK